jgi:hypothetical protein
MKKVKDIKKSIIFTENQRLKQLWFWFIIATVVGLSLYAFIYQIVLGKKFGNSPMPDSMLILTVLLAGLSLPILFFLTELRTRVTEDGLYVKYFPFHQKWLFFSPVDIENFKKTKYRPVLEYGGYGIRIGINKKAYNVSGNMGIELTLSNGKRLLIGTQKPDEFESAMQKMKQVQSGN